MIEPLAVKLFQTLRWLALACAVCACTARAPTPPVASPANPISVPRAASGPQPASAAAPASVQKKRTKSRWNLARIEPAADLAPGEVEVRLTSKLTQLIDNQEITLAVRTRDTAQGNSSSELKNHTSLDGVVRFQNQATETDHTYRVTADVSGAHYSSPRFQFRAGSGGMRVLLPVYEASPSLDGLLILSRCLVAIRPRGNSFLVDSLWRIENYSETAWLPDKSEPRARLVLPQGAKAITIRKHPGGDARLEKDGEGALRLAGTFAPGQNDLMVSFQLDSTGESTSSFRFPSSVHLGSMRVLLDDAPGMTLRAEGFSEPVEARTKEGQRRLISSRDFFSEKVRAPDEIEVHITGSLTPGSEPTEAKVPSSDAAPSTSTTAD